MNLDKQLRLFMDRKMLTLTVLAKQAGISKSTLSGWVNGVTPRDIRKLKSVAEIFGVTIDHLVYGEGLEPKSENFRKYKDEIAAGVFEVILRKIK